MSKSTLRIVGASCSIVAILLVALIPFLVAFVAIDLVRQPLPVTSFARSERNFDNYERELEAVLAQHNLKLQRIVKDDELPDWRPIGISDAIVRGYFVDIESNSRLEIVFSNSSYFEQVDIAYFGTISDKDKVLENVYINLALELFNSIAQTQFCDEEFTTFLQGPKRPFYDAGIVDRRLKHSDSGSDRMIYRLVVCPDNESFRESLLLSGRGFGVRRPIYEWLQW